MKEIFESTLEKIFSDHVTPEIVLAIEQEGWSPGLWQTLEESGFALAAVPEELGGAGASWDDLCGVMSLCGRFALPLPLPEAILGNWLLGACGVEGLAGSLSIAGTSELQWQDGVVSGWVKQAPWGQAVDQLVAVAGGETPRVVVLSSKQASTIECSANIAGETRDDLFFEHANPIVSAPLAEGLDADVLHLGGAMIRAGQMTGALEEVMKLASEYVNERVQFGRPIGKFQAVQHQLAVLAEHVAATRIASQAAFAESGTALAVFPIMAAKICGSEAAGIGASSGHSVHGAIGFTQEYRLHLLTRRLWSWRSEFGSGSYWSEALGRAVCARGANNFWPTVTAGYL